MAKWFKVDEFRCKCCGGLGDEGRLLELMERLDKVREVYGRPMPIMSGYRCPKRNVQVGGAPLSRHLKSEAADIVIGGSRDRYDLVKAALSSGFRRIGIGKGFVHLDISDEEADVLWLY